MATLQKIRNHGVILLIIVGLAMLAFILGDFLNSGSSFFNRSRENIAVIEGEKIHYTTYEAAKDQLTEVYKIESGRSDFDEDQQNQIRNQIWQMTLMDYILRAQCKKIGMDVTADELSELCIGEHPHQLITGRRAFFDENGQFNRNQLVRFLASLEQETENPEQAANIEQAKTYWMYWENAVRLTQMQEKYTNLLQSLIQVNSLEAQFAFDSRQSSVSVDYVVKPYLAIADSTISVNDRDLKKLYNLHRPLYKQKPNRAIEYVCFDIKPSEQDFADTKTMLEGLKADFAAIEDVAYVVNPNSDLPYDGRNYSENSIPKEFRDFAFRKDAKAGDTTDILFFDNTFAMARIMECGYSLPDSVELRPIIEGEEEQPSQWYQQDQLAKEIADKAFACKAGQTFTIPQGDKEMTIEVTDIAKATPKAKVAILARTVIPSSKTYSILYNEAKQFIINNNNAEMLKAAAQEAGLTVYPQFNLDKNADKVAQLKSSRPIVRWAFEAKEGQVSDVFECGDQFIVAALTEINDGDYRSFESVKAELQNEAIINKKAAQIIAELTRVASLDEAAQKASTSVQHADNVTFNSYRFGNAGVEPAVLGTVLNMEQGALSAPIKGNAGVYVVLAGQKNIQPGEANLAAEKQQMLNRYAYSIPYQAISMLEDKADIVDNRANFQ